MPQNRVSPLLAEFSRVANAAGAADGELLERYVRGRDETAFAALVRRHGPMALGVCRRVLGHAQDAEDAFQAVLLVLARKAGCIRQHSSLGSWLHGVAFRVALKARAANQRRRAREEQTADQPAAASREATAESCAVVDEELSRLPEEYRLAVVLYHLEGNGVAEGARQLGWTEGQFRGALFRGRRRLIDRLLRRGIAPALALTGATAACAWSAPLPAALQHAAAEIARAAGSAAAMARLPVEVVQLAEGVLRDMTQSKIVKMLAVIVTLTGLVSAGLAASGGWLAPGKGEPQASAFPKEMMLAAAPVPAEPAAPEAGRPIKVASPREGVVRDLRVKEGEAVKEGQLLLVLDDRLAAADVDICQAKVEAAKADREAVEKTRGELQAQYKRYHVLADGSAVSQNVLEESKFRLERAQADVVSKARLEDVAKKELRRAQVVLEMHSIRSPVDGTVKALLRHKGEAVATGEGVVTLVAAKTEGK
jgi:RNA polymerase sigma factor (sigma-70 family)